MTNNIEQSTQAILEAMRQREKDFMERKALGAPEQTPEQIEAARRYWENVFAEKPGNSSQLVMARSTAQEMEFEDARKRFWAVLQFRAAQIEVIENRPFKWCFDEQQAFVVQNMIKYFINDPTCTWPLSKGLFVYGAPGTGKTEIMEAFEKFCNQYDLTKKFIFCSLSEIHNKAKADKDSDPVTPNIQNDRCFDEFGRFTGAIVRYGDSLDINEAIIEHRYQRNRRYGQLTHYIANATPNEMEGAFTLMVFDRLRSMCTSVHFSGKSKR